ncbi:MAG TPA: hypothetical protein VF640_02955, partial [Acidimicrobiales bacterium]
IDGVRAACRLVDATWARVCVPTELAVAVVDAGGYVAVATAGGEVVAASIGFLGSRRGEALLHSHVTAVTGGRRGGGVGRAVKLHQRAWAMARGVPVVAWTFDPLRRANARFNLVKLGASAVALHPDHYGPMDDAFNAGDLTDRIEVRWEVGSAAAVAAAAGRFAAPDDAALLDAGAAVVLDPGPDDGPVAAAEPAGTGLRLVGLPRGLDGLDAARRRAWRLAVRAALGDALAAGAAVAGFTAGGRYVVDPAGGASPPSR